MHADFSRAADTFCQAQEQVQRQGDRSRGGLCGPAPPQALRCLPNRRLPCRKLHTMPPKVEPEAQGGLQASWRCCGFGFRPHNKANAAIKQVTLRFGFPVHIKVVFHYTEGY